MPDIVKVVYLGVQGPSGVGITAAEKTAFDGRIAAVEAGLVAGAGSPERSLNAPGGVMYRNTNGGGEGAVWYKAAGTGSGGWLPVGRMSYLGWHSGAHATPNGATIQVAGTAAWTLDGTATNDDHTSDPYVDFATSTSINTDAGPNGPAEYRRDWDLDVLFKIRLGADTTTARYWIGLADTNPLVSAAPTALNLAAFRFDTGVPDTTWQCRVADGANASMVDSGVAAASATAYRLRITLESAIVRFYIDDVYVAERSTNLPTSTAYLRPWVRVRTAAAAARHVGFAYFQGWHG